MFDLKQDTLYSSSSSASWIDIFVNGVLNCRYPYWLTNLPKLLYLQNLSIIFINFNWFFMSMSLSFFCFSRKSTTSKTKWFVIFDHHTHGPHISVVCYLIRYIYFCRRVPCCICGKHWNNWYIIFEFVRVKRFMAKSFSRHSSSMFKNCVWLAPEWFDCLYWL